MTQMETRVTAGWTLTAMLLRCCWLPVVTVVGYSGGDGGTKQTHWTVLERKTASNPVVIPNIRSALECVIRCQSFSHCTAFAFDTDSGTCSLFPVQKPQDGSTTQAIAVFWDTDLPCQEPNVGNGTTRWQNTLTSVSGYVTCNNAFMYSHESSALRCRDDGVWDPPIGQCRQYFWENERGDFLLPRTAYPGWAMCFRGTPTKATKFRAGTLNSSDASILHAGFIFDSNNVDSTIVVNVDKVPGGGVKVVNRPFPFTVGVLFSIVITLLDAEHTYSLSINGEIYSERHSSQPISELRGVYVDGDVEMMFVNVWCGTA